MMLDLVDGDSCVGWLISGNSTKLGWWRKIDIRYNILCGGDVSDKSKDLVRHKEVSSYKLLQVHAKCGKVVSGMVLYGDFPISATPAFQAPSTIQTFLDRTARACIDLRYS